MASEIRERDVFGENRSGGKRAWHGLGVEIPDGKTARETFPLIGLDWPDELLVPYCDQITPNGIRRIEATDYRIHVRADTGDVLGVVSNNYRPISNRELADFADGLAGADAAVRVETAGSLYNGRRIFCLVKMPNDIWVTDEDMTKTYVCISNGHGGFAGFNCYPTGVRVVCDNTIRQSERDLYRGLQFQHQGDVKVKLKQARTILGCANDAHKKFEAAARAMFNTKLSVTETESFLRLVWEQTFCEIPTDGEEEVLHKLIAKRDELVKKWMQNIEEETAKIRSIEGTLWAAFNGVTKWHDHQRGNHKPVSESQIRVHSNLFGSSNKDKQIVLKTALAQV